MVRETGLEPVRVAPHAPQTCASADSATLAYFIQLSLPLSSALRVEQTRMRGTACGSQNFQRLGAPQNFDRYAIPSSLDPPPAALRSECCRFRHSRILYKHTCKCLYNISLFLRFVKSFFYFFRALIAGKMIALPSSDFSISDKSISRSSFRTLLKLFSFIRLVFSFGSLSRSYK